MAFVGLEFNEEEYELPARDGRLDAALRNALQPVSQRWKLKNLIVFQFAGPNEPGVAY